MFLLRWLCPVFAFLAEISLAVTVYQVPLHAGAPTSTSSAPGASTTVAAAYDPTVLTPPPIPSPAPPLQFSVQLSTGTANVSALPISSGASFLGFSIEMSVTEQVRE